jgi:hypothetical protein
MSWEADNHSVGQEILTLSWNQRFIIMFARVRHKAISSNSCIQSTLPYLISLRTIWILLSHIHPGLLGDPFPSGFPTTTSFVFICISHSCYMWHPCDLSYFYHSNVWWTIRILKLLIMQTSPSSCYFLSGPNTHPSALVTVTLNISLFLQSEGPNFHTRIKQN